MVSSSTIFIFTKDRPSTLIETIKSISSLKFPIIILDDSYLIKNRQVTKAISQKFPFVNYHGSSEQKNHLQKIGIKKSFQKKFIKKLGRKGWNLGNARNYAVLLGRSLDLSNVLFMDDDIIVEDKSLIKKTFALLKKNAFVGAKVTGMPDDSVTGYIVRELKQPIEEYLSGGFLAFNPFVVTEYFINLYNEDWIWLYLHELRYNTALFGEVKQLPNYPFRNAVQKAKRQEMGEVLVDGVKEALKRKKIQLLKNPMFWKKIIQEKEQYYTQLKKISLEQSRLDFYNILSKVADYSIKFNTLTFSSFFANYFKEQKKWISVLQSL